MIRSLPLEIVDSTAAAVPSLDRATLDQASRLRQLVAPVEDTSRDRASRSGTVRLAVVSISGPGSWTFESRMRAGDHVAAGDRVCESHRLRQESLRRVLAVDLATLVHVSVAELASGIPLADCQAVVLGFQREPAALLEVYRAAKQWMRKKGRAPIGLVVQDVPLGDDGRVWAERVQHVSRQFLRQSMAYLGDIAGQVKEPAWRGSSSPRPGTSREKKSPDESACRARDNANERRKRLKNWLEQVRLFDKLGPGIRA